MSIKNQIVDKLKVAMKSQDKDALRALRGLKSMFMLAESEEKGKELSEQEEIAIVMKAVKQRRDSIDIYKKEGREDLLAIEESELKIFEEFLPKQLTDAEIQAILKDLIAQVGASSMADIGKVMPLAMQKMASTAAGGEISKQLKNLLS